MWLQVVTVGADSGTNSGQELFYSPHLANSAGVTMERRRPSKDGGAVRVGVIGAAGPGTERVPLDDVAA